MHLVATIINSQSKNNQTLWLKLPPAGEISGNYSCLPVSGCLTGNTNTVVEVCDAIRCHVYVSNNEYLLL